MGVNCDSYIYKNKLNMLHYYGSRKITFKGIGAVVIKNDSEPTSLVYTSLNDNKYVEFNTIQEENIFVTKRVSMNNFSQEETVQALVDMVSFLGLKKIRVEDDNHSLINMMVDKFKHYSMHNIELNGNRVSDYYSPILKNALNEFRKRIVQSLDEALVKTVKTNLHEGEAVVPARNKNSKCESSWKYYEFNKHEYYAMIKANDVLEAIELYFRDVGGEDCYSILKEGLPEEINKYDALKTYILCSAPDMKFLDDDFNDLIEQFEEDCPKALLIDGSLL